MTSLDECATCGMIVVCKHHMPKRPRWEPDDVLMEELFGKEEYAAFKREALPPKTEQEEDAARQSLIRQMNGSTRIKSTVSPVCQPWSGSRDKLEMNDERRNRVITHTKSCCIFFQTL
jgi:hypothetical protein